MVVYYANKNLYKNVYPCLHNISCRDEHLKSYLRTSLA